MILPRFAYSVVLFAAALGAGAVRLKAAPAARGSIPILIDTDLGTDIDDAFAVAFALHSPQFKILGITTVAQDTAGRAHVTARLLAQAGQPFSEIPVYAGDPGPVLSPSDAKWLQFKQLAWGQHDASPSVHLTGAVAFLRATLEAQPGRITLVALGQLTNLADLLRSDPGIARKIARIVLMGGSIEHGYDPKGPPSPEWNIRCDVPAARTVFAAGIPLLVIPLDSTMQLQPDAAERAQMFADPTLGSALHDLYTLWGNPTPTFCDVLTLMELVRPDLATTRAMALRISDTGMTEVITDARPNAEVVMTVDRAAFMRAYIGQVGPGR